MISGSQFSLEGVLARRVDCLLGESLVPLLGGALVGFGERERDLGGMAASESAGELEKLDRLAGFS